MSMRAPAPAASGATRAAVPGGHPLAEALPAGGRAGVQLRVSWRCSSKLGGRGAPCVGGGEPHLPGRSCDLGDSVTWPLPAGHTLHGQGSAPWGQPHARQLRTLSTQLVFSSSALLEVAPQSDRSVTRWLRDGHHYPEGLSGHEGGGGTWQRLPGRLLLTAAWAAAAAQSRAGGFRGVARAAARESFTSRCPRGKSGVWRLHRAWRVWRFVGVEILSLFQSK